MTKVNNTDIRKPEDVLALIGAEGQPGATRARRALRRVASVVLIIVLLLVTGVAAIRSRGNQAGPRYQTEAVTRGTLRVTVSATGNLQPINKVDVGSELSGTIDSVMVDDNDRVKKGQVLARLDESKLKDQITQSEATLASAQAKEAEANAALQQSSANLDRLQEVSRLSGGKVPSKTEMETAQATLAKDQAELASTHASVNEARAGLSSNQTNLAKASIRSPIDGIVLKRSVESGQTVAASLQVATLFTIAEDLREMELDVAVDEADVGNVQEGQDATFTVDAYPNRTYTAKVTRVAYGSTTSNNVVSYTTTLRVRNEDLTLRPGMTATAEISTVTRENALLVPNAALRFTPASGASGQQQSRGLLGSLMPRAGRVRPRQVKTDAQQVWILRNGQPAPVAVTIGQTDGRHTEITGGDVREAQQVITDSTGAGQ